MSKTAAATVKIEVTGLLGRPRIVSVPAAKAWAALNYHRGLISTKSARFI